jgi:beta-carotene hydroxylase
METVVRGRVVPRLLLGLTYHLEHHLYPEVPSFRVAGLVRALEPWLATRDLRRVELW